MPNPVPDMRVWGLVAPTELERIVVVSPHLDDAVLGCGRLMARYPGTIALTVYAGAPDAYPDPMTHWDAIAGFAVGDDVLSVRRREDDDALRELECVACRLDFVEHQYLERADWIGAERIVDALESELRAIRPTAVFLPFGIANPDHGATHDAGVLVRDRYPEPSWFCYEDAGYKHIPGLLAWRISGLFHDGVWPTPVALETDPGDTRKLAALACYPSQRRALEEDWQLGPKLVAPEQYWRLAPPPAGWERLSDPT